MSRFLTPQSVAARPDGSYFSPEKLAMLKRIFDAACKDAGIASTDERDAIAIKLLTASKTTDGEDALIVVLKDAIASYRIK
jgi:hypothetical protein